MTNEEKILTMLEKLNGTVEKQGETLEKLNSTVDKHSEILEKLSDTVDRHSETLSEMQKTLTRIAVTQENVVIPQIKLLAEGHTALTESLIHRERIEKLEEDVSLLKVIVKDISRQLDNLQQAQ